MAQAEPAPLPEALQARMVALVDGIFAASEAGASAEQKATAKAQMEAFKADPSLIEPLMANMKADYDAADANGDGILDAAESNTFIEKMDERDRAEGRWADTTEAQKAGLYAISNAINGDREGYDFSEWL